MTKLPIELRHRPAKKQVGKVTATVQLIKQGKVEKNVQFIANVIRDLGCDAIANIKLSSKILPWSSTEPDGNPTPYEL